MLDAVTRYLQIRGLSALSKVRSCQVSVGRGVVSAQHGNLNLMMENQDLDVLGGV